LKDDMIEKAKELGVEVLAHCEFDKKGRLVDMGKANAYLKYLKSIYFETDQMYKE